jgi:hypothetical protein
MTSVGVLILIEDGVAVASFLVTFLLSGSGFGYLGNFAVTTVIELVGIGIWAQRHHSARAEIREFWSGYGDGRTRVFRWLLVLAYLAFAVWPFPHPSGVLARFGLGMLGSLTMLNILYVVRKLSLDRRLRS